MNNQDIKNALGELEPEEGARIALDYLRGIGRVVKVWERDDLLGMAEQDPEFDALSEDDKSLVLDYAVDSSIFESLEESNDYDTEILMQAVDAGMVYVQGGRS